MELNRPWAIAHNLAKTASWEASDGKNVNLQKITDKLLFVGKSKLLQPDMKQQRLSQVYFEIASFNFKISLLCNGITSAFVFLGLGLSRECDGCCCSFRNSEVPYPLLTFISPSTFDKACSRVVFSCNMP